MYLRPLLLAALTGLLCTCQSPRKTTNDLSTVLQHLPKKIRHQGSLNVLVVGDWGRNGSHHQSEVADQMNKTGKEWHADFVISTGDNFYPNGVKSIHDKQWLTSFENIYTGGALQCKWYPVLGNHDYRGTPQAEVDYTKKSSRWTMPDRYYSITKKINDSTQARFIFLDTQPFVVHNKGYYSDLAQQDPQRQLNWLDSVLTHGKEQWKIVVAHHPVYSSNPRHGNSKILIDLLKPRLEKHGVQLYISGHDHDLQHQQPEGSVDYFISGAGSQTRRTSTNASTKFSREVSGFAALSMHSDSLYLHFIDYKGNVVYHYSRGQQTVNK